MGGNKEVARTMLRRGGGQDVKLLNKNRKKLLSAGYRDNVIKSASTGGFYLIMEQVFYSALFVGIFLLNTYLGDTAICEEKI